jgi:hypothetical protein
MPQSLLQYTNCDHGSPRFCFCYLLMLPLQYVPNCYQPQNLLNSGLSIELQHKKYTGTVVPIAIGSTAKRPEAFGFALIFFATFLHQGKKVEYNF